MTRKLPALILPLLLLVFVARANAVETTTSTAVVTTTIVTTTPIQSTAALTGTSATNSASKLREQIKLLQEQKKTTVTQIKDDLKSKLQTEREEFKLRIQTIKDQTKRALVERIDARLAETNANQTAKFADNLNRLQEFLDRFSKLTTGAVILADVKTAQTAIDTAKTAVAAQAAKSYTMTIVDDATLKLNAGTVVSQLRTDLAAVYKLVVNAKQAVQKLNPDRDQIKKEATSSAKI